MTTFTPFDPIAPSPDYEHGPDDTNYGWNSDLFPSLPHVSEDWFAEAMQEAIDQQY